MGRTKRTCEPGSVEPHLDVGDTILCVSFPTLAAAREAARRLNLSGRDVKIFEMNSGKVVELSVGVASNPPTRPTPTFSVAAADLWENPQSLSAAD